MRRVVRRLALATTMLAGLAGGAQAAQAYSWSLPVHVEPPSVPADNPMSNAKVVLGRRLFYDADLSIDGTMSCATCHEQRRAFTDGNATHPGVAATPGRRNVMGLANVAYFDPLTWADPRQHSLEEQMLVPLLGTHPVEMGMNGNENQIAKRLGADACYRNMFTAAFPASQGAITLAAVTKAIAAFERTLLSFDSPYDRYSRGDTGAISATARRGAAAFFGAGLHCAACHSGPNFTDGRFHRITFDDSADRSDRGLAEVTGRASDHGKFRTPSLRNIALTAPYMHDGSVKELGAAIRAHFAKDSVPLSEARLSALIAFLRALSDPRFVADPEYSLPKTACGKPL